MPAQLGRLRMCRVMILAPIAAVRFTEVISYDLQFKFWYDFQEFWEEFWLKNLVVCHI